MAFDESKCVEIWRIDQAKIRSAPSLASNQHIVGNVLDSYHYFAFDTPSIIQLSDNTIAVADYVTKESIVYVRCCRMIEGM